MAISILIIIVYKESGLNQGAACPGKIIPFEEVSPKTVGSGARAGAYLLEIRRSL
jgi:hypothetical protein